MGNVLLQLDVFFKRKPMHSFWFCICKFKKLHHFEIKFYSLLSLNHCTIHYFSPWKDVVDEDVEQNNKVPLQRMPSEGTAEEVHDEENDGYNYEEDDFEVRLRLSSSCYDKVSTSFFMRRY